MSSLRINELKFNYSNRVVFKNISFSLRKGKTLSIIGESGSGKTTLLRILNGELEYEGEVSIDGLLVNKDNFDELKYKLAVVYDYNNFLNEVVKDELRYSLEHMNIDPKDITERIEELNLFFSIKKIFNKPISILSTNDKVLIKILSYAIYCPMYLAIDDLLSYLDEKTKLLLLNYLNYKNITLINVTSDMEDTIYTDYTLCLYRGIIAIDGKTIDVLKEEKLIKRLGFSLPFYLDLSIQLKLYNLIKKTYLNKEGLIKELWK